MEEVAVALLTISLRPGARILIYPTLPCLHRILEGEPSEIGSIHARF